VSKPTTQIAGPKPEVLEVDIRKAKAEDVAALRGLLLEEFGYIYLTLLGPDYNRASATLDSILKANRGRHPIGYESFYVAQSKDNQKETHGILKLKAKNSDKNWDVLFGSLSILGIAFHNLGVRGTVRALRKWRVIQDVNVSVEADELHIVYLAVSDVARGRYVGKQLLNFAKLVARSEHKKILSLHVREKNINARKFFLHQGFSIENTIIDTEADELLMHGAMIRMVTQVATSLKD